MSNVVYVVDDDDWVRRSTQSLIEAAFPVTVRSYASGTAFLADGAIVADACLVLDMRMPGMCGSDVLEELRVRDSSLPTILVSGHSDSLPSTSELPSNVLGFLEKPARAEDLLGLIRRALARD